MVEEMQLSHEPVAELKEKIKQLKIKCNKQIEKILEQDEELVRVNAKNELLEIQLAEKNRMLEQEELFTNDQEIYDQEQKEQKNELLKNMDYFCNIVKKIIDNDQFIAFKNSTKNAAKYCKVEKAIFDSYIETNIEKANFFEYCIDFALLKSDENRKYVWSDNQDKPIRIYFVNKALVNMLSGDSNNV